MSVVVASLLSPSVTRRVIDRMAQQATPRLGDQAILQGLTPRERQVLQLIARGPLGPRNRVVKRILMKVELRDRVQAVIFAYETGLTRPGGEVKAAERPIR